MSSESRTLRGILASFVVVLLILVSFAPIVAMDDMSGLEAGDQTTDEGHQETYQPEEGTKHYHERNQTSFGSLVQIGTSLNTINDVEPGDIDNDGTMDLITVDSNGDIGKRRNSGDPFSGPSAWPSWTQPVGASDADLGDLDNDGDLDIVTTNGTSVFIYENPLNPGGVDPWTTDWSFVVIDTAPPTFIINTLKFADLDNDGDLDIAYRHSMDIVVLENPKNPGGDPWQFFGWSNFVVGPSGGFDYNIDVADIDLDGYIDIVSYDTSGVRIWENDGSPFNGGWWDTLLGFPPISPTKIAVGDIDNDGDTDIVSGDMVEVRLFQNPREIGDPFFTPWTNMGIGMTGGAYSLALSDLDNDGWLDIAFSVVDDRVYILDSAQTPWVSGSWQLTIIADQPLSSFRNVRASDLDSDGDSDIIACAPNPAIGNVLYAWNNTLIHRNMPLRNPFRLPISEPTPRDIELGDFDNDGDLDVVSTNLGGSIPVPNVRLWRNDEPWDLTSWSTVNPIDIGTYGADGVKVADLDNDGDLDLVTVYEDSGFWSLFVWENPLESVDPFSVQWSGGAGVNVGPLTFFPNYTAYLDVGDLDGDGDIDVATHCRGLSGIIGVRIWRNPLNEGGDPFTPGWSNNEIGFPPAPAKDATSIAIGDLDRDGDADIVSGDYSDFWVEIRIWENLNSTGADPWSGSWSGGTGEQVWILWSPYPEARIKLSDLDNDGDLDVPFVLTAGLGLVKALRNPNDPATATNEPFTMIPWINITVGDVNPMGKQLYSIDVGDMDNDGDDDIATGDALFGPVMMRSVMVWANPLVEGGDPWLGFWDYDDYLITDGFGPVEALDLGDLDNKNNSGNNKGGDLDVAHTIGQSQQVWFMENIGAQVTELVTPDSTPPAFHDILEGSTEDLMRIDVTHNGVSWDNDAELTTWRFLFEDSGAPLATAEAQALFNNMYIYLDSSGDYAWQPSPTDTVVMTIPSASFSLVGGYQTFSFSDPDTNTVITADMNETYFLVVQLSGTAASAIPNTWNVTFDPDGYLPGNWNEVEDEDEDRIVTVLYDDPTFAGIFRALGGTLPDLIPGDLPIPTGIEVDGVPVTGATGNPPVSDQIDVGIGTTHLISSITTNIGVAGTGVGFDAAFYNCTSSGAQLDPAFYVTSLPSLASGASSAPFSDNWDAPLVPSTDYYVCILVDSGTDIVESNELNNTYIVHFHTIAIPLPDLTPNHITITTDLEVVNYDYLTEPCPPIPILISPGFVATIDFDATNVGVNMGLGETYVIAYYETASWKGPRVSPFSFFESLPQPPLLNGEVSSMVSGFWLAPSIPGNYYVNTTVDNDTYPGIGDVLEMNDTNIIDNNNTCALLFQVQGPDLIPGNLPTPTDILVDGSPVTGASGNPPVSDQIDVMVGTLHSISTTATNIGLGDTGSDFNISFYECNLQGVPLGPIFFDAWMPPLAPGASSSPVAGDWTAPPTPGTHTYVCINIDNNDVVVEINEMNNLYIVHFYTLGVGDILPPRIYGVTIDKLNSATYSVCSLPGTILLEAVIDDELTGGSVIGGGNYTIGFQSWPGTNMNPGDGSFDTMTEAVNVLVDISGWGIGTYQFYVYGWDVVPNYNTTSVAYATLRIIDNCPPLVEKLRLNGQPTLTVTAGASVTVTATLNDTSTGKNDILSANYTIGIQNWPGIPMNAVVPPYDNPVEDVVSVPAIDTTGWSVGLYDICVYGSDVLGNNNTTGACATLSIAPELIPPEIYNVLVDGQPIRTYYLSSLPALFVLTATVNDTNTGGSNIGTVALGGANYTLGTFSWPGTAMSAVDGTWSDDVVEPVTSVIATPSTTGTYTYCVYGWDEWLNYNTTSTACATLTIADDIPPEVLDVHIDGAPTQNYGISVLPATIVLTATIDDTNTGGSDIAGANHTMDAQNWPGSPMSAFDGSFDSAVEDVTATVDTSSWGIGTYMVCVYGWDAVPNHNSTGSCAQLTIFDDIPPEISDSADPDPQKVGGLVNVTADITDNVGVVGAWMEILDPSGNSLGNSSLSFDAESGKYFLENIYTAVGAYTYTIWAVDADDNWNSSAGTFEIEEETRPETRIEYNWKPIIALLFTIILLLFGLLVSYRRPHRFSGNLQKDRMYTFMGGVLPFMVAEITTGIVSLITGFLSVPPILGLGMAVDVAILLSGIIIASVIFKKGEMPANYDAGTTTSETGTDAPPTTPADETSDMNGQETEVQPSTEGGSTEAAPLSDEDMSPESPPPTQ